MFIPAALAFFFAAILQWRLLGRLEKFLTRLERDRVEGEEKAENRRLTAQNKNALNSVEALKTVAMNNRNQDVPGIVAVRVSLKSDLRKRLPDWSLSLLLADAFPCLG